MLGGKVLIDADIVAYRAAAATEKDFEENAKNKVDELMVEILENTCIFFDQYSYEAFLSGRSNFRYDVDSSYKANRAGKPKPRHLGFCRDWLVINYNASISEGQEADDNIAIRATELGKDTIIASVDKDLMQVPCLHYNFTSQKIVEVTEEEAMHRLYSQVLTGDRVDNIQGIKYVGPKKADKILKGCVTELDYWKACVDAYGNEEEAIKTARLVYLRRKEGELWQPPNTP